MGRWRSVVTDDQAMDLTVGDWKTLHNQLAALRDYWTRRLTLPKDQRQTQDETWRNSI